MMQAAWFMTLFIFSIVFFLVFFVIYFFRPKKDDKIIPETLAREPVNDAEVPPRSPRAEPNWPAIHAGLPVRVAPLPLPLESATAEPLPSSNL